MEFRRREVFFSSKIFNDGQTQVPADVRRDLNVQDGDSLLWIKKVDGYLVRSTVEPKPLYSETLKRGGITCKKCGTNYEARFDKCPKCGESAPKTK